MKLDSEACHQALKRIRATLSCTPCTFSPAYSEMAKHEVYFKFENKLRTGSFKERGALNFLLSLDEKEKAKGICSASAGNHALALSYHAAQLGISCTLVMPLHAPLIKVQASERNGARVILCGETLLQSHEHAQKICAKENLLFVSPYDHPAVIAGQGTCGLEILEQCSDADTIIVPVGGGGLISGIAIAVKAANPKIKIIGVQSQWAVDARKGKHGDTSALRPLSIADGIAVKQSGSLTQPIIDKYVDHMAIAAESEIASALVQFLELEKTVIEGAAAAAVTALLKNPARSKKTLVVISGSNIDMNTLSRLIDRDMAERERLLRMVVSVPDRPGSLHATTGIVASQGANVLQVLHDRSFSLIPGNVEITFLLEVRNGEHKKAICENLKKVGISVKELS